MSNSRRWIMHVTILAIVVPVGLLAIFARTEKIGAQEVDPDQVRILLTVEQGDSCRGLASTFAGNENYCGDLILQNPYLRQSEGRDLKVGDRISIPPTWNQRVLDLNGNGHMIAVVEVGADQPEALTNVTNNNGYDMTDLLIIGGIIGVVCLLVGALACFVVMMVLVKAPGTILATRPRKVSPTSSPAHAT